MADIAGSVGNNAAAAAAVAVAAVVVVADGILATLLNIADIADTVAYIAGLLLLQWWPCMPLVCLWLLFEALRHRNNKISHHNNF